MTVLAVLVGAAARTGGPPAFVGGSALALARLGVTVRIVATDLALNPWGWLQRQRRVRPDELHPSLMTFGIELFPARLPRRLAFSPSFYRRVRKLAPRCDVVHIHNLWHFPQYAAYKAAVDGGVPYIVSPHGALDPYVQKRGRVRKGVSTALWQGEMLRNAALIHVTTDAEKSLCADVAPQVPRVVVPCGLHIDDFTTLPHRNSFRQRRLGGYDGHLILFLGRIAQKKGIDVLIRAFERAREVHECRLVIAGPDDSGLRPKLMRLVEQLDIVEEVTFIDGVYGEERLAALSSADVWALPSHAENFGIAVVEAMAAGCPVVTSPGVNLSADIQSEEAGVVAEPAPEPFSEALLAVLTDDERRMRLRRKSRAFAARYDWSVVAPQLLEMYRSVMETKTGA